MGKILTYILHTDQTFEAKHIKTNVNHLELEKDYKPTFKPSSIFNELKPSKWKFWKSQRKICILVHGATSTSTLDKLELNQTMFSLKEIQSLVKKVIGKSKAYQKLLSTWQTFGIFGLLGAILAIQLFTTVL